MSAATKDQGPGIRVSRKRGYTIVFNDEFQPGMSARAWGIYSYLRLMPDGWEARAYHLQSVFEEGRDAIYKALNDLVDRGMMAKEEYRDGNLRRYRYVLDADQASRGDGSSDADNRRSAPDTDFQDPETPDAGSPDAESADAEIPPQRSTYEVTTDPATTDPEHTLGSPLRAEPDVEGAKVIDLRSGGKLAADGETSTREAEAKPKGGTAQGHRLPEGWTPDEALKAWTAKECPAIVKPGAVLDEFRDYWTSQPGIKGRKTDWDATWRNWCRKVQRDLAGPGGRGPRPPANAHRPTGENAKAVSNRLQAAAYSGARP